MSDASGENAGQNPFGKGMAFPMMVGADGRMRWSAGERNIEESLAIILRTEPGERVGLPGFGAGLGLFLFEPNEASTHARIAHAIDGALRRWEPRIAVEQVEVGPSAEGPETALAAISYRLVADGRRTSIALAVPLATASATASGSN